jgi:CBS domain-containing protein
MFPSDDSIIEWRLQRRASRDVGGEQERPVNRPVEEAHMTVKTILAQKGSDVATIEPTATLAQATKLLADRRIGAVLILGIEGRVAGILSERDIVRVLAERGAAALNDRVDQVMTRRVFTCSESDTVAQVMEQMTAGKFRHMPVIEEGKLVGIISIGDVVKHRVHEIESESNALREYILTA